MLDQIGKGNCRIRHTDGAFKKLVFWKRKKRSLISTIVSFQIQVSELYLSYLAKKSDCEIVSRSKWRWKRAINSRNTDLAGAFSGHDDCCPLVVDPLTYIALLSFLVAATYFLWVAVTMNIMGRKRRKRSVSEHVFDLFYAGK